MGKSLTVEIANALAEAEGTRPSQLPYTIGEYIDTEALQRFSTNSEADWVLRASVRGHEFKVENGTVTVKESGNLE